MRGNTVATNAQKPHPRGNNSVLARAYILKNRACNCDIYLYTYQNSNETVILILYLVTLAGLPSLLIVETVTIFRLGLNFARCIVVCPLL